MQPSPASKIAILVALTVATAGCNAGEPSTEPTVQTEPSVETEEETADMELDFSLEPAQSDDLPWLLTVIARNNTDRVLVDHETRILERWDGANWELIVLVPSNAADPPPVACDPDAECGVEMMARSLRPGSTGYTRLAQVKPLEDGIYRMSELADRGYSVSSNTVEIVDGAITN